MIFDERECNIVTSRIVIDVDRELQQRSTCEGRSYADVWTESSEQKKRKEKKRKVSSTFRIISVQRNTLYTHTHTTTERPPNSFARFIIRMNIAKHTSRRMDLVQGTPWQQ